MEDPHRLTYLNLRWLLALLPAVLFVVTVGLSIQQGQLLGSISAYYGGPVRDVFVGVLVSVGVCLVVYEGASPVEEYNFNGAGFYAVFVALVPTSYGIGNVGSVWALRISLTLVALIAVGLFFREVRFGRLRPLLAGPRATLAFVAVTFAVLVGFLALVQWQLWAPPPLEVSLDGLRPIGIPLRVHDLAAIFLLSALAISVLLAQRLVIFGAMVLGPLVAWLLTRVAPGHFVILLEWWEIGWFCAFWVMETRVLSRPGKR